MSKKNTIKDNIGDIVLYETEDGLVSLEVNLQDDTIWLNMDQIATLYDKAKSTISEHIQDIFKDGELIENEVMKKFGNSEFSKKPTNYYNLDVVIAVGYRVRSNRGIAFRKWATKILKEYIKKANCVFVCVNSKTLYSEEVSILASVFSFSGIDVILVPINFKPKILFSICILFSRLKGFIESKLPKMSFTTPLSVVFP